MVFITGEGANRIIEQLTAGSGLCPLNRSDSLGLKTGQANLIKARNKISLIRLLAIHCQTKCENWPKWDGTVAGRYIGNYGTLW